MISKEKRNTSKFIAVDSACYDNIVKAKKDFEKKGIRLTLGATVAVYFAEKSREE